MNFKQDLCLYFLASFLPSRHYFHHLGRILVTTLLLTLINLQTMKVVEVAVWVFMLVALQFEHN
jgi:hypothetical protein